MNFLIFLTGIVFSCCTVFAQDASLVLGNWQAVVMSNNEMFYDLEKDSFVVNKDYFKIVAMDSEKLDSSIRKEKIMMRELIEENRIKFNADQSYTVWYGPRGKASGHYVIDTNKKIVTFFQEEKEKVKDKMKYRFSGDKLEIKLGDIPENDTGFTISGPESGNTANELTIIYKKVNQF